MKIKFNEPTSTGDEMSFLNDVISQNKLSGDGPYGKKCEEWFEKKLKCNRALLTPNCTQALEMAALLIGIKEGDEIIMPSYTFVSTANAFVLRGAKIVFVDIRKDTMNIDEKLIEKAITERTKAIVPVHYGGVGCEMDKIMNIASKNNLFVIEDAAQGMMSQYKNRALGSIGHIGTFSFHETKNYTSGGEGGLLIINDQNFVERAEIIREKGTNRKEFFRGMIDKYSWVDVGSSYLLTEIQAAYLWSQIQKAESINNFRKKIWKIYYDELLPLKEKGFVEFHEIPDHCEHNAHMFFIKLNSLKQRTELINFLKEQNIDSAFHYIPLHSSAFGKKSGIFAGEDNYTTKESERLLRLPIWFGIKESMLKRVISSINIFFKN
tara:strand:+ start:14080 stop:15216 length:1137 start_codon:yes stop_codon:yes gene_type:complete